MTPTRAQLESNISKTLFFNGLWTFFVILPVVVPFFQSRGLTMKEVFELQSIFGIALLLFEVPSGYVSDLFGRRNTLVAATVVHATGFMIFPFADGFWALAFGEILLAAGVSLFSGTDVAMLYDSLEAIGDKRAPIKVMGRKVFSQQMGETLGALAGGALVLFSLEAVVWGQALIAWAPLPIALSMVEPPRDKMPAGAHRENFAYIARSLFGHSRLLTLILANFMVYAVSTLLAVWAFQKYWSEIGVPVSRFGLLWAMSNLTVALTARRAHKIEKSLGSPATLAVMAALPVLGYFAMAGTGAWWGALLCVLFQASRGINSVVLRDGINRRVPAAMRATANSVASLGVRVLFILAGPVIGGVIDARGTGPAFSALGTIYIACFFLFMVPLLAQRRNFEPIPGSA